MKKIASIAVLMLTAMVAQAQKVTFYSPEFENGVRYHIGLGESDDVLQTHTDTITTLNLSGLEITDIRDAVYLTAVTKLDLSYNGITDVSPLLTLSSLRELNLSNNKLEDINILAFVQAESMEVDVFNNYISDFSYFYTRGLCEFNFLGMGMQLVKDAPYFDVYQLHADVNDEEQPVISYRGYTNMTASAYLKYGSSNVPAQLDGNSYQVVISESIAETTQVTISNGEVSENTYVVPVADYRVEAGKTVTLITGLPDDYNISSAYANLGTVEIVGNSLQYTATDEASPDIIYFNYVQGSSIKGSSRIYINREEVNTVSIKISSAKQVTYMSDKDLDFMGYPDLKAYVATGYDKGSGTIWLTRVKEVPANTGFLLMGEADTYEIPVKAGGLSAYYQNMFKGTIEGTTIQTTEGSNTNYYLSNGDAGVGFYKVQGSVELKPNRAYLSVPTEIPAVGTAGSTETIKVSAAGQVPYYNSQSLDFSSLDAQGVKAYTATGYDYSSGTIWLTRVKQVPAETGILIMAPQGEYPVPTASVASVYANMFKGTLTGTTIQTHETIAGEDYINYYLSSGDAGVGFYRVTKEEGVNLNANRCYLPIKNKDAAAGTRSVGSGQNQIAFEEADEVIGIQLLRGIGDGNGETTDLTPALSDGEGEWYTLQGQRVAKPGKGLYIRNGKVVVVR